MLVVMFSLMWEISRQEVEAAKEGKGEDHAN